MAITANNWKRLVAAAFVAVLTFLLFQFVLQSLLHTRRRAELVAAVHNNEIDTIVGLVMDGTSANVAADDGLTPLMVVSLRGSRDQVSALIRRSARVNSKDAAGQTPLMYAKDETIAEVLLEAGADINMQDKNGETALMMAVNRGNPAHVRLLLRHGANRSLLNSRGQTALVSLRGRMMRRRKYSRGQTASELASLNQDLQIEEMLK